MIFSRLDAEKEGLGLTTYKGQYPRKSDLKISKNYLDEKELNRLNLIVSGYLDIAEYQAETQTTMTMEGRAKSLLEFQRADIFKKRQCESKSSGLKSKQ